MRLEFKGGYSYFGVGAVLLSLVASGCIPMQPLVPLAPNSEAVATASKDAPRPTAEEEKVVAMMEAAASRANHAAVRANAAAKKPEAAAMKAERAARIAAAAAAEAKKAAKEAQSALKKAFLILMSVGR